VISTTTTTDDTATYTFGTPEDVPQGDFAGAGGTASSSTQNALPSGLTLTMVDNTSAAQDQCQGATVNIGVAAS
jgi:hypothetical protein